MEAQLSDELYIQFRDLLLSRSGLYYPERKRADLAHGLALALNATCYSSLSDLYVAAVAGGGAWDALMAQLTVGETYFFRNSAQFDALRRHIIPEIIARRTAVHGLRIWSAGCSSGEEPYSVAMLLQELLPKDDTWQVSILATDINHQALNRAREALYGEWSFRETPAELRARFFIQEGARWRLSPQIRRMVTFAHLNLAEAVYPAITNGTCALDIIFCRNVTIYFDEATTRQIVERFYNALSPGGWLIVGHAEPQASIYKQFEVHNFPDTIVYRKSLNAPLFAFDAQSGTFSGIQPILTPTRHPPPSQTPPPKGSSPTPSVSRPNPTTEDQAKKDRQPNVEPVAALLSDARRYADRGEWQAAAQACEQALTQDPLSVDGHYLLAQIYEHQGLLDEALTSYRRTVYLDRKFVLGAIGMGNVWRQMGQIGEAQRGYRVALRQLSALPPATQISGGDGVTARELIAFVTRQLQALKQLT